MEDEKPPVPARKALCGKCIPSRYIFALLGCLGMIMNYTLRVNFFIGIVRMVNHTYTKAAHKKLPNLCHFPGVKEEIEKHQDGPLLWSETIQGVLLSGYFIGYLLGQFPGGRGAEIYDAKWVFWSSIVINVLCVVLIPVASTLHWGIVLFLRILMGFGGGFSIPSMHVLLAYWAPPKEVSFMATLIYAGVSLGTLFSTLSAGYIAENVSWQAIYYIHGGIAAVWLVFWGVFIEESPSKQKFISEEERQYILDCTSGNHRTAKKMKIPWRSIFTSKPFYALMTGNFTSCWCWFTLLTLLPQYMKRVLRFTIVENAIYTSIPYLTMWIFGLILGRTLDYMRTKEKLSTTKIRKLAVSIQAGGPAICLCIICIFHCQRVLGVVLMTISITLYGALFPGLFPNHLDMAPNYAGTLMAFTNTIGSLAGVIVSNAGGLLLNHCNGFTPWFALFLSAVGWLIIEIVIFLIFGSGEIQPWNVPKEA